MQFIAGLVIFALFFMLIFVIGLILLFRKTWLLPWLRANIGIFCLFFGIIGSLGLFLLSDLQIMDGEYEFGQVEIKSLSSDMSFMQISSTRFGQRDIELSQKNWRLRAIHLKWTGWLALMGLSDGVLLYDMQESNNIGVTNSTVIEYAAVIDVWRYSRQYLQWLPGIAFDFLSTDWYPSALNTVYDLRVTKAGLTLHDTKRPAKAGTAQALFE